MPMRKIFFIFAQIKKILATLSGRLQNKKTLRIAILGSSNSVMRTGYAKYLDTHINKLLARPTILNYYSLGGVHSIYGLIQEDRHQISSKNDIIFFEFCVTDRYVIEEKFYSLELAGKTLEGFIRKAQKSNPKCLIVILIFSHLDYFYDKSCNLTTIYESIANKYNLPVINVTRSLRQMQDIEHIEMLYEKIDPAHYIRPHGVKVVAEIIVSELIRIGTIQNLKLGRLLHQPLKQPIYSDNFGKLTFFDRFEDNNFFGLEKPKIEVYQNSIFQEKYFPISQGNSLNFLLKGRLVAILVKADLDHGFIKIEFGNQSISTSTYASWLNSIKPRNAITLVTLPLIRFSEFSDFTSVSISNCVEHPQDFELEYFKILPTQPDPRKWKLNIIGVAYIGELKVNRSQSNTSSPSEI
jgi:hypothetical protein